MNPLRLLIAALLLASAAPLQTLAEGAFRAGAFAQDITPTKLPSPINGNMKGGSSASVHDPMHARCLALNDGASETIFCVVDACMIPREICEKAKALAAAECGVPASRMLVSATHSHSCATMVAVFQSDPDPAYVAEVPALIAKGMVQAHRLLEPAQIAWGKDSDSTQVFNRRWFMKEGETYANPFGGMADRAKMNPGQLNPKVSGPTGPVDPEVSILAVRSAKDQRPLAVLANYSLHYVGGLPAISADYFAAFADALAAKLKADDGRYAGKTAFVGIMSNGTSGNINNINFGEGPSLRRKAPGEQILFVANSVSDAAMRAYDKLVWHDSAPLSCTEKDIMLKVRKATAAELIKAKEVLATTPLDKDGQHNKAEAIYAREATLLDAFPDELPVKLQAHRIGELSIASIPCEVFVEIGLDLKQSTPFAQHFTISLGNGYNGYLPTAKHHELGGYETWRARSSYLEVGAAEKISTELKAMLRELRIP